MASVRQYAYYMEGSKISLIEKEAAFDNDPNSKDYGPGTGRFQWKSPLADVTDGLEILYTYSPTYRVYSNAAVDVNKFYVNGWTVIGGYLSFLRARLSTIVNWSSGVEATVTSGSSGNTGGNVRDYIVVGGSSRWNGLHRVQTAGTEGQLITYTKVSETLPYWEDQNVDFNTSEAVFGRSGGSLYLADYFSIGDYVFISGSNDEANNGLFSIDGVKQSSSANSSKITLGTRYAVVNSSDATSSSTGLDNEYSADAALAAETSQSDINVYKAHRDFCYVLTDVDTLNDEGDEIDLPNYLSKSAVDYVKAKYLEDAGKFKEAEYFMAKFRKQVEKYRNRLIPGPRMIASGPFGIR
jgi:hypothetical protein